MTADPDDPTYGYFLLYADPPPSSRNLPDARTDADAIQAAMEVAFGSPTAVHLRHYTESGTQLIGIATADGVFTPAAVPDQHHDTHHPTGRRPATARAPVGAAIRLRCCRPVRHRPRTTRTMRRVICWSLGHRLGRRP